jgi:hypothetical protein
MTPAAVLAILVAAGEAGSPVTAAMTDAAAEVVGNAGAVRIVEAGALSDSEALRTERQLSTRVVVQLAWADAQHLRARLRLHAARTDRWINRELAFAEADTPAERGRAVGFAIASMLPEGDPSLALATSDEPREEVRALAPVPGSNVIDATFLAGAGLGGPAGGLGGRLAYERFVIPRASVDLALAVRLDRISNLDARELTSSIGLGGSYWLAAPTSADRIGLAMRSEALLIYESVAHADAAGATSWKGHALLGVGASVEGTLRVTRALELVLRGGAELAFGTVDVTVVATRSASGTARLPASRALAGIGLRARF